MTTALHIKGRKRFVLVDMMGLLVSVKVMAANVPEREGAKGLKIKVSSHRHEHPRLVRIFVDGGFSGKEFMESVFDTWRFRFSVVLRLSDVQGFYLLPKRWVVERTFEWFNWWRRLSKDRQLYCLKPRSVFIYVGMLRLILRRLASVYQLTPLLKHPLSGT